MIGCRQSVRLGLGSRGRGQDLEALADWMPLFQKAGNRWLLIG